jgi:hypothetical protein
MDPSLKETAAIGLKPADVGADALRLAKRQERGPWLEASRPVAKEQAKFLALKDPDCFENLLWAWTTIGLTKHGQAASQVRRRCETGGAYDVICTKGQCRPGELRYVSDRQAGDGEVPIDYANGPAKAPDDVPGREIAVTDDPSRQGWLLRGTPDGAIRGNKGPNGVMVAP